ncbi:MAG TPA: sigma 54-interacting transcriptional regulator, partial [Gemmatimonadales bacterium]|nr:sigma 54-interacting transcriptional regulator [Gemmatimonadales bacterium]
MTLPHGNRATPRAQRASPGPQPVPADPVEPASTILNTAIAASEGTIRALERIHQYARAGTPVVFVGETGTGKSYFARGLHEASGRRGPFLDVTAGELDPGLALSQLFGHVRGSFTGAVGSRPGLLAEAAGGTLLLDDFHLMKRSLQAMLLRALERRVFHPVGSDRDVPLACRIVVGMSTAPDLLVARRRLLPDLRFRLG